MRSLKLRRIESGKDEVPKNAGIPGISGILLVVVLV